MHNAQILMGLIIVAGSLLGWRNEQRILAETTYGSLLRRVCGERHAPLAWRLVLVAMAALGLLFATHILQPLRWR